MDANIVLIYCLCDDFLKEFAHQDDQQCLLGSAEIMTIGIVAAFYFHGNHRRANDFLYEYGYLRHKLSRSRLCRRMKAVAPYYEAFFGVLAEGFKERNTENVYSVDSMPFPVCDKARVRSCRIYPLHRYPASRPNQKGKWSKSGEYGGWIASKRQFYYGVKLSMLVTESGAPVEFFLSPARLNDATCLGWFHFDMLPGSTVYADRGYISAWFEETCKEYGIDFIPMRRSTDAKQNKGWQNYLNSVTRKAVERTFSAIERKLPRHIHAVTASGFETKIGLFVLAIALEYLLKGA